MYETDAKNYEFARALKDIINKERESERDNDGDPLPSTYKLTGDKMKSGTIIYNVNIKVPIEIGYHLEPGDKSVGLPEHILVDFYNFDRPANDEIHKEFNSHASEIKEACLDDVRERSIFLSIFTILTDRQMMRFTRNLTVMPRKSKRLDWMMCGNDEKTSCLY